MTAILERRSSPAAQRARGLAAFAAVLFITSAAGHRFGLVDTVPFFWLLAIAGSLAAAALCLAALGFAQVWEYGLKGSRPAAVAVLLSLCVLAPYLVSAARMAAYPRLNDIATDPARPPGLVAASRLRSGMMNPVEPIAAEAAELQQTRYPGITGRRYDQPRERVVETVIAIFERRGWRITRAPVRPGPGGSVTIEALARSYFLGFPADVSIRVEEDESATYVDMRSSSRYGAHDLGDNAARVSRFLDELDRRMSEQAGL